ncbi:Glycoside hydrolase, family 3 domain protein [Pelomyxa schiedti]|nr:Glycoside hydrolase, family 3 domain protein [Pelomyxa schiedti]
MKFVCLVLCVVVVVQGAFSPVIEQRVADLMASMTLEEKVAQLLIPVNFSLDDIKQKWGTTGVGAIYIDTTGPNLDVRNSMQSYFISNSRLGIPIEWVQEALHSGGVNGTIYPMPVGLSCTWDEDLVTRVHQAIALDSRVWGASRTMSPNMNLYVDPRFGRFQEGFGEDPLITSRMAVAAVKGLQGSLDQDGYYNFSSSIMSNAKHFAAYGITQGGQDGTVADISERTMRDIFLKPWQAVVDAGVGAIMPSHNEIAYNGIPAHGNKWLLTDILMGEMQWEGLISSDFGDIQGLQGYHLAESTEDAAVLGITAGVHMDLGGTSYPPLVDAVNEGKVDISLVNTAVHNVLYTKFATGVMDEPYADTSLLVDLDTAEHRNLALEAAEKSIVLLKNSNNMLPLDASDYSSVAVIGPLGDDASSLAGGYTEFGANIITPLEGIRNFLGTRYPKVSVSYAQGANVMDESTDMLAAAVTLAQSSDLVFVVIGDNQDTCQESWGGRTGDVTTLDFPGGQQNLLEQIVAIGKPTVVVLVAGRPKTFGYMNSVLDQISALLVTWRPGEEGGNAIANIAFGLSAPYGRLTSSWPYSVGQIWGPAHPYWQKYRYYDDQLYTFEPHVPLFPFGFGLTYTSFTLSALVISPLTVPTTGTVTFSVTVRNTGSISGSTVVQLYIADRVASVVRWKKMLYDYKRVTLDSSQSQRISLSVSVEDLGFWDASVSYVVEPGWFDVWVSQDCIDTGLTGSFLVSA